MTPDPAIRAQLASHILSTLQSRARDSTALLRGSLALGTADAYSDIDVLWEVPDDCFDDAVAEVGAILGRVQPIESLRIDPDFQHSDRRRLIFVRFADVPLFWRLDVDVMARSIGRDETYDRDNPTARGVQASPAESALMNAIAAVKAHLRGDDTRAGAILAPAFARIALERPHAPLRDAIVALIIGARATDPSTSPLAQRIYQLIPDAFA